jgi:DNA polymerase-3 subunit gamma/tau
MLQSVGELEPRFRKSGQQQLLLETLLVRFALLDRAVDLEDVLRSIGAGAASGAPPTGAAGSGSRRSVSAPQPVAEPPTTVRRDAQANVRTEGAAVRATPAPVSDPRPQARVERDTLELAKIVGRWDDLVERMRVGGKPMLATALMHASAVAVTADGVVAIELDEPNDIYAHAINTARTDVVGALSEWFDGITRADLRRQDASPAAPPKRLTDEMVRAERIASLKRRDPVLSAAIDALDLDVAD